MMLEYLNGKTKRIEVGNLYTPKDGCVVLLSEYVEKHRLNMGAISLTTGAIITVLREIDYEIRLYSNEYQMPGVRNFEVLYNGKRYNLTNISAKFLEPVI
jgi:hypothetical protein